MTQNFRRSVARRSLFALAVLLVALPGLAQQTLGSLNGTVVDSSGAAVPGETPGSEAMAQPPSHVRGAPASPPA